MRTWNFLPDRDEVHRVPRRWLGDIIYSVVGQPFKDWRDNAISERHSKIRVVRNLDIAVTKVAFEAFHNSKLLSTTKGKAHINFQKSTQKRRKRAQIDAENEKNNIAKEHV